MRVQCRLEPLPTVIVAQTMAVRSFEIWLEASTRPGNMRFDGRKKNACPCAKRLDHRWCMFSWFL